MKILIWGFGYVGSVSAACLARQGHDVTVVEINRDKVDALNKGRILLKEPRLQEWTGQAWRAGRLRAVRRGVDLVQESDISLVCVGTPGDSSGAIDCSQLRNVLREIGAGLRTASGYHVVNLRSTVFPGTSRRHLIPLLEKTAAKSLGDFGFAVNPEFLREGSGVKDFEDPPFTVVGAGDERAAGIVSSLYLYLRVPLKMLSLEAAEMLKLTSNAFHSLKVGFSNEIGRLCAGLDIDSHQIMNLLCEDTKLNVSPAYLSPGFAFGGPCLGKDLRALLSGAQSLGADLPILASILPSNRMQFDSARARIKEFGATKVGILGLSFKAGTDDLRESPVLELVTQLREDGHQVLAYDPDLAIDQLVGVNRESVGGDLSFLASIVCERAEDLLQRSQVIVVAQKRSEFATLLRKADLRMPVLDLVRVARDSDGLGLTDYSGISW